MNIPNLPVGKVVDSNGNLEDSWLTFFQNLITALQTNTGTAGLVAPTQDGSNILTIQNATTPNPSGGSPVHSCQYGTILYNSTANSGMFAVDNGSGSPVFKTMTLT